MNRATTQLNRYWRHEREEDLDAAITGYVAAAA